jgi:hypothetical protein
VRFESPQNLELIASFLVEIETSFLHCRLPIADCQFPIALSQAKLANLRQGPIVNWQSAIKNN